ncbi:MAG: Nucleoid-associated protein YbaB [Phycisphaerae bacterium]|nr:Nucleoid-associated protein YbaB [Phycisphaerae bacterium]
MFGQLGQLTNLLKNAGKIREGMKDMQARMAAARHVGEAGGGQARAVVDGTGDLVEVRVDPALLADKDLLEDLVCAAVRDGIRRSREAAAREMSELTGGMDLGGMSKMLGGLP